MASHVESSREPGASTDVIQASATLYSDITLTNPILEFNKYIPDVYAQLDIELDFDITQLVLLRTVPANTGPADGPATYTFSIQFVSKKVSTSTVGRFLGQPGPTGIMGFMGVYGYSGSVASPAPTGPFGYIGFLGLRGPPGPTGVAGPKGAGVQGPPGPQGPIGPFGPVGSAGSTGATGPMGPTGAQGPTGAAAPGGGQDDDGVARRTRDYGSLLATSSNISIFPLSNTVKDMEKLLSYSGGYFQSSLLICLVSDLTPSWQFVDELGYQDLNSTGTLTEAPVSVTVDGQYAYVIEADLVEVITPGTPTVRAQLVPPAPKTAWGGYAVSAKPEPGSEVSGGVIAARVYVTSPTEDYIGTFLGAAAVLGSPPVTVAYTLPAGSSPTGICKDDQGNIYVSCVGTQTIHKFNVAPDGSLTLITTYAVGVTMRDRITWDGRRIWGTDSNANLILWFNPSQNAGGEITPPNSFTLFSGSKVVFTGSEIMVSYSAGILRYHPETAQLLEIIQTFYQGPLCASNMNGVAYTIGFGYGPELHKVVTQQQAAFFERAAVGQLKLPNLAGPAMLVTDTNGIVNSQALPLNLVPRDDNGNVKRALNRHRMRSASVTLLATTTLQDYNPDAGSRTGNDLVIVGNRVYTCGIKSGPGIVIAGYDLATGAETVVASGLPHLASTMCGFENYKFSGNDHYVFVRGSTQVDLLRVSDVPASLGSFASAVGGVDPGCVFIEGVYGTAGFGGGAFLWAEDSRIMSLSADGTQGPQIAYDFGSANSVCGMTVDNDGLVWAFDTTPGMAYRFYYQTTFGTLALSYSQQITANLRTAAFDGRFMWVLDPYYAFGPRIHAINYRTFGLVGAYNPELQFTLPTSAGLFSRIAFDGTSLWMNSYPGGSFPDLVRMEPMTGEVLSRITGAVSGGNIPNRTFRGVVSDKFGTVYFSAMNNASGFLEIYKVVTGASVGLPSRRTPTDSSTLLCWTLNETAAPFASTGSNTSTSLTVTLGSVTPGFPSIFLQGVLFNSVTSSTGVISSGNSSVEPTLQAFTVSCWVKITTFTASGIIVAKAYRNDGTYNTPFNSLQISEGPSPDGTWNVGVTVGGTRTLATISTPKLVQNEWIFLAMTWDGNNVLAYLNGALASTTNVAFGPNNVDFGTHGPWNVGNTGTATTGGIVGTVDDVRVESVVRSAAYLTQVYKTGLGLFD
jgi:streptogramin lyase